LDWTGYEALAETARAALPLITAAGLGDAEELEIDSLSARLRTAVVAGGAVAASPALVGAFARV
jgi:hypothetical protein